MRGDKLLFKDLSFQIRAGEALYLQGANGSGKTSLLRLLAGLTRPESGHVRWAGVPIARCAEDFHRSLIYLGHLPAVKGELTPVENLLIHCALAGQPVSSANAQEALGRMGLGRQTRVLDCRHLSQGQRRRVGLARLLLSPAPPLWLLDEPFTALDASAVTALCDTVAGHLARGGMVVYTSHQSVALDAQVQHRLCLDEEKGPRPC